VEQLTLVHDLQESHSLTAVCEAFELPRSTVNYRRCATKRIAARRVNLNAMVKAAHTISNGSAGARSIARIVTRQGTPLSRYRATGFMTRLELVSTQLRSHRYNKATQPHVEIPNQ
jgi:putative transposase